jgi:hypothetical protein
MSLERRDCSFKATDGIELKGWLYPAGIKKPTIIISHGVSEQSGMTLSTFKLTAGAFLCTF